MARPAGYGDSEDTKPVGCSEKRKASGTSYSNED